MNKERPSLFTPEPPDWWHEAIRTNLPGTQVSPDSFQSFQLRTENGIPYEVFSITKDPSGGTGIFIYARVPNSEGKLSDELAQSLVNPIKELITNEAIKRNLDSEIVIPPEVNKDLSSLGISTNLKTVIAIAFMHTGNDNFVISLTPVNVEEMKARFRMASSAEKFTNDLIDNFFKNLTYFRRIKYVSNPALTLPLKKAILKREIAEDEEYIKVLLSQEPPIVSIEADMVEYDDELEAEFAEFLKNIGEMKTAEEEQVLIAKYDKMGVLKLVGWMRFYRKYWEDKLGEKLL